MLRLVEISEGGAAVLPGGDIADVAIDLCLAYDRIYQERGFVRPWVGYLAVRDGGQAGAEIVGACGFQSRPVNGRVEVSFLTFRGFEKQGVATMMMRELAGIADGADPGIQVYARVGPQGSEAGRVLERAGFTQGDIVDDPHDGMVQEWVWP